jgi:hypothetical protein
LHDAVERRLHEGRQPVLDRRLDGHPDTRAVRDAPCEEIQGRREAEVVEDRRPEVVRQRPQVGLGASEELRDLVQAPRVGACQVVTQPGERQVDGGEELSRLVVELTSDPPRFLFPRLQDPERERAQPVTVFARAALGDVLHRGDQAQRFPAGSRSMKPRSLTRASQPLVVRNRYSSDHTSRPSLIAARRRRAAMRW